MQAQATTRLQQAAHIARNSKARTAKPGARSVGWTICRRTAGLPWSRRAALDAERTFFARNAHWMDCPHLRRNGWPMGSGAVETACKSVVQTRLYRGGVRGSRSGGQHILSLRTHVTSDRWNATWSQYKRIECSRSPCDNT
jgi:hypothetical protein